MLLFVLDFLSLVLVESEWLVVYLFTLLREFKMSRRRQQRQRQKSNRLRLCSHYSVNGVGPGRHKSITHIETSRRRGWPGGFGALNSSPHSRIFTFVSEGSSPRSYFFISHDGPNNSSHCAIVWHKTYPTCDALLSRSAWGSFAPSQKSGRHDRSCV